MQGVKLVQILVSNWFETESIMTSGTLSLSKSYITLVVIYMHHLCLKLTELWKRGSFFLILELNILVRKKKFHIEHKNNQKKIRHFNLRTAFFKHRMKHT